MSSRCEFFGHSVLEALAPSCSPGDLHEAHRVDLPAVHSAVPHDAHAVLDAVHPVRDLREVVAPGHLLLAVERAVVGSSQM